MSSNRCFVQSAVLELSDEDLDSEIDADTLLDISVSDADSLDMLNTHQYH